MKLSIVTPSYNQFDYLKLCVASVNDQSGVEVEHIVQDAGSGGGLEAWLNSQAKVKLFIERDHGMYDAINRGLRRAEGEICAYLNCDEQYLPGTLVRVAQFFAANPEVNVLFGDVVLVDQGGWPLSYRRAVLPTKAHVRLAHLNTASCATFFRRELVDRGFYFDPQWKTIGDAVWIETLLRNNVKMATIREPLAVFTFTGKNLGDTELSRSEIQRWRGSEKGTSLRRLIAVLGHRFRKAWAGAYRRRRLAMEIYTLESPERREPRFGKMGFSWPRM